MPEIGAPKGVTKHTDLTDKEVANVIDHADGSITNAKIVAAAGIPYSKLNLALAILNADIAPAAAIAYAKLALTGALLPADLSAIDSPADGEAATYDSATGRFEWAPAAGLVPHDKTYHTSPTLPDTDAHKTASPIDHPDLSVSTAKIAAAAVTVPKLGFSTWEKISEVVVTGTCDYVDFNGLDVNTDGVYVLYIVLKNATASEGGIDLFVNGDNTITNYYSQQAGWYGSLTYSNRWNAADISHLDPSGWTFTTVEIVRNPNGYAVAKSWLSRWQGSSIETGLYTMSKVATVTNITSIRIAPSVANAIAAGSRFILYRVRTS